MCAFHPRVNVPRVDRNILFPLLSPLPLIRRFPFTEYFKIPYIIFKDRICSAWKKKEKKFFPRFLFSSSCILRRERDWWPIIIFSVFNCFAATRYRLAWPSSHRRGGGRRGEGDGRRRGEGGKAMIGFPWYHPLRVSPQYTRNICSRGYLHYWIMNRARLCALLCVYAVCVVTWIKEAPRRGAVKNSNGVDEKVNVGFRSIVPRTPPSLSFPFSYPARLPSLIDSPSRLPGFPSFDQSFYGAADVRSVFEWRTYTRARARAYTRIHTHTYTFSGALPLPAHRDGSFRPVQSDRFM